MRFYEVEYYTLSDARTRMLVYAENAREAEEVAKKSWDFAQMASGAYEVSEYRLSDYSDIAKQRVIEAANKRLGNS